MTVRRAVARLGDGLPPQGHDQGRDRACHSQGPCRPAPHPPDIADRRSERPLGAPLTAREISILELIAEGRANQQTAEARNISEATVKYYVSNVLAKLGVPDRTQAAIGALERGIAHLSMHRRHAGPAATQRRAHRTGQFGDLV
jgi:DNA-binding NarL/FixJ family response regulator